MLRSKAQIANSRAFAARGRLPLVSRSAASTALDLVEDLEAPEDRALALDDRLRFSVVADGRLDVFGCRDEEGGI